MLHPGNPRLDVFPIELPPLRARASDVEELGRHLVQGIAERLETAPPELAQDALGLLAAQDWPGNVRWRMSWSGR